MAVQLPGTVSFRVQKNQLIEDALQMIGVNSFGQTPLAEVISHGSRQLNLMIKAWMADGLQLWKIKRLFVFMEKNKSFYDIGPNGDFATEEWDFNTQRQQLAAGAVATDLTITVDDASNISDADFIGIVLDDGNLHTTTVNGAPAGDVVTITDAMPSAAATDNRVIFFTTKANRPLKLVTMTAVMQDLASGNDRPITDISQNEYTRLSNKFSDGAVAEVYFDPQTTLINDGTAGTEEEHSRIYTFPQSSRVTEYLEVRAQFPIQDITEVDDDFDFPQEWLLAIQSNLAVILAPSYGVPNRIFEMVTNIAETEKERVMGWDHEFTSVMIQPWYRGMIERGFGGSY